MLTKVQAYSSWGAANSMLLDVNGSEESDLIQIRNIDGLSPVKAAISTSSFGSIDGAYLTGNRVDTRNIVLTIHPNPDWRTWTHESLRRFLYKYFTPELLVRLVFYSDDIPPVEIYGYVEDFAANQFVKDPEYLISIICPDPYFTAVSPTISRGVSNDGQLSSRTLVDYAGDIETGCNVKVEYLASAAPNLVEIIARSQMLSLATTVDLTAYFELNSISGSKYVRSINYNTGLFTSLLSKLVSGSEWPTLQPGINEFAVVTNVPGEQGWTLTYFNRYGGL